MIHGLSLAVSPRRSVIVYEVLLGFYTELLRMYQLSRNPTLYGRCPAGGLSVAGCRY